MQTLYTLYTGWFEKMSAYFWTTLYMSVVMFISMVNA